MKISKNQNKITDNNGNVHIFDKNGQGCFSCSFSDMEHCLEIPCIYHKRFDELTGNFKLKK